MKQRSSLKNNRSSRPTAELQSDSKTLRYEVENLLGIASQFDTSWTKTDPIRNNAFVEAFAVHCRALVFFLYGHTEEISAAKRTERFATLRENDVIAYDYDQTWVTNCPSPAAELVHAKWQADKHVAHITTDRREVNQSGSPDQSVWPLGTTASAICRVMRLFLDKAPHQGFDSVEKARMEQMISDWIVTEDSGQVQIPSTPVLGLAQSPATCFHAKTDARTISPQSGFNMHGKTE